MILGIEGSSVPIIKFHAYRFLVQAKKLLHNGNDNYPLINYGNKYGTQVDLLMNMEKCRAVRHRM